MCSYASLYGKVAAHAIVLWNAFVGRSFALLTQMPKFALAADGGEVSDASPLRAYYGNMWYVSYVSYVSYMSYKCMCACARACLCMCVCLSCLGV